MLCYIYRSEKKLETYLYLSSKEKVNDLPEGLDKLLGKLNFVMELDLDKIQRLENADIVDVKKCLQEDEFYLQLPKELHVEV